METTEDSLKISENEDGSFTVEWDKNDPRYFMFNEMSQEQMQTFIEKALEDFIKNAT